MIDEILKVVKIDLGQGTQSVEEYQKALDSAAKSADNLNDELGDLKTTADGGILKGVTAGFDEAVDATLGEIGKLDVEVAGLGYKVKDFAKVFKAFTTTAISGMNGLKLAIAGTGIGLLIIAAGTLYARWDEFKEAIGLTGENIKKFKDMAITAFKNVMGAVVGLGSAIGASIVGGVKLAYNTIKDFGKEVTKLFKGLFNALADPSNFTKIAGNAINAFTSAMKSSLSKSSKDLVNSVSEQWSKGFEAGANSVDKILDAFSEKTKEKEKKAKKEREEAFDAELKKRLEEIQYQYDYEEKLANVSIENERKREDQKFKIRQEGYERQLAAYDEFLANTNLKADEQAEIEKERQRLINEAYLDDLQYTIERENEIKEAQKQEQYTEDDLDEETRHKIRMAELIIENEAQKEEAIYQIQLAALERRKGLIEEELKAENLSARERTKLENKLAETKAQLNKKVYNNTEDFINKETKKRLTAASATLNTYGDLLTGIGNLMAEGSTASKAILIAGATMQAFGGAINAYTSAAATPIVGPYIAPAAAAAALLAGIANVKKIAETDPTGESTTSAPAETSISTPAQVSATPQIPQIGVTPLIDEYRDLQRMQSINISGDSGMKVYVLEEDIRNVGNRVSVRESEASF